MKSGVEKSIDEITGYDLKRYTSGPIEDIIFYRRKRATTKATFLANNKFDTFKDSYYITSSSTTSSTSRSYEETFDLNNQNENCIKIRVVLKRLTDIESVKIYFHGKDGNINGNGHTVWISTDGFRPNTSEIRLSSNGKSNDAIYKNAWSGIDISGGDRGQIMLGTNGNAVVSGDLSLCDNNIILKTNYDVGTAITSAEMSIDGKIGIGTSNPQHELTVQGTIYTSESSVVTSSDSRIKTDISLVNDDTALNQVNKLESYQYNYTDPLRKKEMKTIGFIAQEVKEVIPTDVSSLIQTIPDEMRIR